RLISIGLKNLGSLYHIEGLFEEALNHYTRSIALMKEIRLNRSFINTKISLGYLYRDAGQYVKAIDQFLEAKKLSHSLQIIQGFLRATLWLGGTSSRLGKYPEALAYFKEGLKQAQSVKDYYYEGAYLIEIGHTYEKMGDLRKAMEQYRKAERIFSTINHEKGVISAIIKIGEIYRSKGMLEKSLHKFQESLTFAKEVNSKDNIVRALLKIGLVYELKKDFSDAHKYYIQGLDEIQGFERGGASAELKAEILYSIIRNQFQLSLKTNALKEYLKQIEQIYAKWKIEQIQHIYLLAEALILKNTTRLARKFESQQLFYQLIARKDVHYKFRVEAILELCDLLLEEIKITGNLDLVKEINALLDTIIEKSQTENLYSIIIQIHLIKSKTSLLELKFEESQTILDQAFHIAKENQQEELIANILEEKRLLSEKKQTWEKYGIKSSLQERVTILQLDTLINKIISEKVYHADPRTSDLTLRQMLSYLKEAKELSKSSK
ncbi:MAG: tetratricopeptide repeat protein, partial [Promethearchaeota archaeon]